MYPLTELVPGKQYTDAEYSSWLSYQLRGVSRSDISDYLDEIGYNPEDYDYAGYSSTITDTKLASDLNAAKRDAQVTGNTKLENTLDFIFKWGEKGLAIAVKAGLLNGPALAKAGYSNISQDKYGQVQIGQSNGPTQKAPSPFGVDFSNPVVLVGGTIIIVLFVYLLFFSGDKQQRR